MAGLVSVIIPAHNRSDLIADTLVSVLNQTYPSIEIIVVDDHSDDDTYFVVDSFRKCHRENKIILVKSDGWGACAARNCGFQHSTGAYIQFFDDDDLMLPEFIKTKVEAIESNEVDFATCNMSYFKGSPLNVVGEKNIDAFEHTIESQLFYTAFPLPAFLVKRSVIEKMGCWDTRCKRLQDLAYFHRLFLVNAYGIWLSDSLIRVRVHDNQISSKSNPQSVYSCVESLEFVSEEWKHRSEYLAIRKIITYHELVILKKLILLHSLKFSLKTVARCFFKHTASLLYVMMLIVKYRTIQLPLTAFIK